MKIAFLSGLAMLGVMCPITVRAQMVEADVLVRAIARGDIVALADFGKEQINAAQARYALHAEQAAGKEARRALPMGSVVRATDIAPPTLVHRGDAVTVRLRSGTMHITAPGKALGDAGAGEPIRIFNIATNRTIDAQVRGAGEVEVEMP